MPRVAQSQLLCVHSPPAMRANLHQYIKSWHPDAVVSTLDTGWLVVESPLGPPVSPLLGGAQPVRFALGEERVLGPHTPPPDAFEALAARATAEPTRLAELPGDFCFVVLQDDGRALAVRSCSGVPALYGFHREGVTAVSTRLDWLARVFPGPLELSIPAVASAAMLLGIAPGHASVLDGIISVPVGHSAQFGRWASARVRRYWQVPSTGLSSISVPELSEELTTLLRAELSRHLAPEQSNAVLFSGGLDSALLAGLCAPLVKDLDAVTLLPRRDHPAHARERHFASALSPLFRQHVAPEFGFSDFATRLSQSPPSLCPLGGVWLASSELARRPATLISGWFADECWGVLRLSDWLERTTLRELPQVAAHAPFRSHLPRWFINRWRNGRFGYPPARIGYPRALRQDQAEVHLAWLASIVRRAPRRRFVERLALDRLFGDMAGPYAENAATQNARALVPFAARELVELAANCPPQLLFQRGHSKVPLRYAARPLLGHTYALRSDKGSPAGTPAPL